MVTSISVIRGPLRAQAGAGDQLGQRGAERGEGGGGDGDGEGAGDDRQRELSGGDGEAGHRERRDPGDQGRPDHAAARARVTEPAGRPAEQHVGQHPRRARHPQQQRRRASAPRPGRAAAATARSCPRPRDRGRPGRGRPCRDPRSWLPCATPGSGRPITDGCRATASDTAGAVEVRAPPRVRGTSATGRRRRAPPQAAEGAPGRRAQRSPSPPAAGPRRHGRPRPRASAISSHTAPMNSRTCACVTTTIASRAKSPTRRTPRGDGAAPRGGREYGRRWGRGGCRVQRRATRQVVEDRRQVGIRPRREQPVLPVLVLLGGQPALGVVLAQDPRRLVALGVGEPELLVHSGSPSARRP